VGFGLLIALTLFCVLPCVAIATAFSWLMTPYDWIATVIVVVGDCVAVHLFWQSVGPRP